MKNKRFRLVCFSPGEFLRVEVQVYVLEALPALVLGGPHRGARGLLPGVELVLHGGAVGVVDLAEVSLCLGVFLREFARAYFCGWLGGWCS